MTAIPYPDCEATSPNGRYLLEARSPDNGTIPNRDRSKPVERAHWFGRNSHQRDFRYRLIDRQSGPSRDDERGSVVWERWQRENEDSPHELVVSDDGWSILRLHGFRPEVVAVSRSGEDLVRVLIAGRRSEGDTSKDASSGWNADYMSWTSAGNYWNWHSWRYFLEHDERDYFVWRPYWGQRLVIDLHAPALLPDLDPDSPLAVAADEAEKRGAVELLASLSGDLDSVRERFRREQEANERGETIENEEDARLELVPQALRLIGVHRIESAIPFLRAWEAIDRGTYWTGSAGMRGKWWLEGQRFRPVARHSLRLLGQVPRGYATYYFRLSSGSRFPMPELVPDRLMRAERLREDQSAEDVLRAVGSPDYVRKKSRKEADVYRWSEIWEYDFLVDGDWTTLRLTWEEDGNSSRMVRIERERSPWLESEERIFDVLRH